MSTGASAPVFSSSSFSVKDSKSPIVFLGVLPCFSGASEGDNNKLSRFDIIAVQNDGCVRRLSSDLETQRWSIRHSDIAKVSPKQEICSCFLVGLDEIRKSLFKRRTDLTALALSESTNPDEAEPSVLLLVSQPMGVAYITLDDVKVHIFSIPAQTSSNRLGLGETQNIRHLLTVGLPNFDRERQFEVTHMDWRFRAGSAGLDLAFGEGFVSFDLSQYSPTDASKFIFDNEYFSSILRISSQSVIGAGKSTVAVYGIPFQSVQRSMPVQDILPGQRKVRLVFLGYFAKLGIVIATEGNVLLSFDISSSSHRKRGRDGLLVEAIGRGIGSSATQWDMVSKRPRTELDVVSSDKLKGWYQFVQAVGRATNSRDDAAFDRAVGQYADGKHRSLLSTSQAVNPEIVSFLLAKIFSVNHSHRDDGSLSSSRLAVEMWPKATCKWLVELGLLSMNGIEIALRRYYKPRILPPFSTGALPQALFERDPSCALLIQVLHGPALMDVFDVAYALKLFMNMAVLSAGSSPDESSLIIANGSAGEKEGQDTGVDSASRNSASANPPTSKGPPCSQPTRSRITNIFNGLNLSLLKLHAHPIHAVTDALRSSLSRVEIISVLHHLRLCLATGGYTSRFTERTPIPVSFDQTSPQLPLNTITDLLNASVDSIGPPGWISAIPSRSAATIPFEDLTAATDVDLIEEIKSEVSATLAGVEEAIYLKNILREYIRYSGKAVSSLSTSSEAMKGGETAVAGGGSGGDSGGDKVGASTAVGETSAPSSPPSVQYENIGGAKLVIFPSSSDGAGSELSADDPSIHAKMLPLSLNAISSTQLPSTTKIKKSTGEVQERTAREMGYLRRKAVGRYSFGRLIL